MPRPYSYSAEPEDANVDRGRQEVFVVEGILHLASHFERRTLPNEREVPFASRGELVASQSQGIGLPEITYGLASPRIEYVSGEITPSVWQWLQH